MLLNASTVWPWLPLTLPPGPCRGAPQGGQEFAPSEFCWLAGLWNSCLIQSHPSIYTQWQHPDLLTSTAVPVLLSCLLTVLCQEVRKRNSRLSGVTGCHFPWECSGSIFSAWQKQSPLVKPRLLCCWGCKRLHPRGAIKCDFAAYQAGENGSPWSGEHTLINTSNRSRPGITALSAGGSKLSDYTRAAYPLFGKEQVPYKQKCLPREKILLYSMLSTIQLIQIMFRFKIKCRLSF